MINDAVATTVTAHVSNKFFVQHLKTSANMKQGLTYNKDNDSKMQLDDEQHSVKKKQVVRMMQILRIMKWLLANG